MAKGIFDSKAEFGDGDEIIARYHFPHRALKAAEAMADDWAAYREPATGGGWDSDIAELGLSAVAIALLSLATLLLAAALPAATTPPLLRA